MEILLYHMPTSLWWMLVHIENPICLFYYLDFNHLFTSTPILFIYSFSQFNFVLQAFYCLIHWWEFCYETVVYAISSVAYASLIVAYASLAMMYTNLCKMSYCLFFCNNFYLVNVIIFIYLFILEYC